MAELPSPPLLPPLPPPPPRSRSRSTHPPDHIDLRVTYLIAGNPRPPYALGLVPASTTIAALKARLQQELLEHPLPHEQRLIYQGRPLLQTNATLQEALRLQSPIGPLPYTIHIIVNRPAPPPQDTLSTGQHAAAPPQPQQPQHDHHQPLANAAAAPVQVPLAHPRLRHLPAAADPMPRPSSAPTHPQHPPHAQNAQFRTVLPFPAPQTHLPLPFASAFASFATPQLPQLPPPSQTTVWLASSSNGPQALLFAPGHGYFTSASSPSVPQSSEPTPVAASTATAASAATQPTPTPTAQAQAAPGPPPPQPGPAPRPDGPDQVARRVPLQPLNANANANANANDEFFAFVLRRGWLFIRLYMFIFVLSEPGTWPRYLLLFAAILVCILPRQNPLNDAMGVARRHLDRLIGPPPRPQRARAAEGVAERAAEQPPAERVADRAAEQPPAARIQEGAVENSTEALERTRPDVQARGQLQPGAPAPAPAHRPRRHPPGSANTTPEETAQRLLREHRDRHPTPILDTLYSIEQSIALFLASLIPGVGERHVAVREEVRREEREARARAVQERAAQQQQQQQQEADRNNAKDTDPPATDQASSSAVDVGPSSNSSSGSTAGTGAATAGSSGSHET